MRLLRARVCSRPSVPGSSPSYPPPARLCSRAEGSEAESLPFPCRVCSLPTSSIAVGYFLQCVESRPAVQPLLQ